MRAALASCAAQFRAKHFGKESASGAGGLETEGIVTMRKLCQDLPAADEKQLQARGHVLYD
jgi:hypothetical protein